MKFPNGCAAARPTAAFLAIPASNDFETTPILHDTMVAILPKGHPMADASVFPLEQLPHENFVRLMEIEDYEFNRLLDQCNIHPEITYDTTSDFCPPFHGRSGTRW